MLLTDLLTPDCVVVPLAAPDKGGVLAELTHKLIAQVGGDFAAVLAAVQEREAVLSTGIGNGVAIPHARTSAIGTLGIVGGVSRVPVPFDALDGEPVRLFFLIVGPEAAAGPHVKALSHIARLVRHDEVRRQLIEARSAEEFCRILAEVDER